MRDQRQQRYERQERQETRETGGTGPKEKVILIFQLPVFAKVSMFKFLISRLPQNAYCNHRVETLTVRD